jgi:hypothetical protein
MSKADEFRKNAGACRTLARQMKNAKYRVDLLEMAKT